MLWRLHLALTVTGSLSWPLTRLLPVCTTQAEEGFLSVGVAALSVIYGRGVVIRQEGERTHRADRVHEKNYRLLNDIIIYRRNIHFFCLCLQSTLEYSSWYWMWGNVRIADISINITDIKQDCDHRLYNLIHLAWTLACFCPHSKSGSDGIWLLGTSKRPHINKALFAAMEFFSPVIFAETEAEWGQSSGQLCILTCLQKSYRGTAVTWALQFVLREQINCEILFKL